MFTFTSVEIPDYLAKYYTNKRITIRIADDLYTKSLGIYENQFTIQEILTGLFESKKELIQSGFINNWFVSFAFIVNYLLIKELDDFI